MNRTMHEINCSKKIFSRGSLLPYFRVKGSAEDAPPKIVVTMPDDVGIINVSAYSHGLMGRTPNIDRIADEGLLFTDHYAHPTCTPGRAAFVTGQLPIRTGLTTVGMAGSSRGPGCARPTLAELLKTRGYRTGQFGKNHLGDRNSHLPTVHGFDEFYGNLYHLNTEEEPFLAEWPDDPGFDARYRPRGVLDCRASARDDRTDDGRFGPMGKQACVDTGPLTPQRIRLATALTGSTTSSVAELHRFLMPLIQFLTIRADVRFRNGS